LKLKLPQLSVTSQCQRTRPCHTQVSVLITNVLRPASFSPYFLSITLLHYHQNAISTRRKQSLKRFRFFTPKVYW